MKKIIAFVICMMGLFSLFAQDKWSVEVRGVTAFATEDLGDVELNTGCGIDVMLDYQFKAPLGAYVGWGWQKFSSDNYVVDLDFEETGYFFGLQFKQTIAASNWAIFARGGGIYKHIEIENEAGDIIDDSDHGWGWEASAGVDWTFAQGWALRPIVKFQALNRDMEMIGEGGTTTTSEIDLNYISIGLGVAKTF